MAGIRTTNANDRLSTMSFGYIAGNLTFALGSKLATDNDAQRHAVKPPSFCRRFGRAWKRTRLRFLDYPPHLSPLRLIAACVVRQRGSLVLRILYLPPLAARISFS